MPKDSLSKYVKKPSVKSTNSVKKAGSWLSNAIKSVGYSSIDLLSELLPSTIDVAKTTAATGKDIAETMKKARSSDRTLRNAIDKNYYINLGREVFKNSLDDLKSGKFYNKERADKFFEDQYNDMMDMGDFGMEDFDVGEGSDDFSSSVESSDGSSVASFNRKKNGEVDVTSIIVNTDLGPDSSLVRSTNYQTEVMTNVGKAVVDYNNTNARAMLNMLGGMRNEFNASLTAINENVAIISSSGLESLSKHSALAAKYYEDSISLQTQILEAIKLSTPSATVNTRTFRDYNNVMDMFTAGGGLDFQGYLGQVKKQFGNFTDSNMLLSQFKFMMDNKETLQMMAQNPLSFIPKTVVKTLIPGIVKDALTAFDEQLKETGVAVLNQVSGLQRSDNAILRAIGQIFGLQNKITIKDLDKGAYNKGVTAWTGTDHQALVNVIPTLLRKIYATVSGTEELGFNYETGQFEKIRTMEERAAKDKLQRETSLYSDDISDFGEYLQKTFAMSREEIDKNKDLFRSFISGLVTDEYGGRTYRKGGRNGQGNQDDIVELLNRKTGGNYNSNSFAVQLIRSYFNGKEGHDNAGITRMFGSKVQEQRALIDRQNRERQQDPTRYNTLYESTGLDTSAKTHGDSGKAKASAIGGTDSHLNYFKDDKTKIASVSGLLAGVVDKYGHNQTYYLREILTTLNTGIYVVPVGETGRRRGGNRNDQLSKIRDRVSGVTKSFKEDVDKSRGAEPSAPRSSYTDERRARDIAQGRLDPTDSNLSGDVIDAASEAYHSTMEAQAQANKETVIGKILKFVPSGTGLEKILTRANNKITSGTSKMADVAKKADDILFQIVFGNPNGHKGFHALFDKGIDTLKAGFSKFAFFIDDKILKPLDEAMFGDDGIWTKFKQTDLFNDFKAKFDTVVTKTSEFFMGTKDKNGDYTGGLFSETANSLKDMGKQVKNAILGERGSDGQIIEPDNSVLGNMKRMFGNVTSSIGKAIGLDDSNPDETIGTKIARGMDTVWNRIKERADNFSNNVFGDMPGSSEFFDQFKEDMQGQKGFIGASAVLGSVGTMVLNGHMGLLGSMFLPGGPIGGALLGAGIGIVSKSRGLQNFLFGPEDETTGERQGGLITKEFQDFFKDNKTGIGIGLGTGLAASFGLLPSFFVPGGPIGGALIGGAISLATKSEAFNTLLYGEGGTKDDPTGGLSKKLKEVFGKDKNLKGLTVDGGIGAGVGIIGSFFLPGGPILGALLGSAASIGLASDKFQTWFFGEKDENGKRSGGVFSKFSTYMKDKIFDPLGKSVKIAQVKILGFVKENMVIPFETALKPITEEAKYVAGKVKEGFNKFFDKIKEKFFDKVVDPIGKVVDEHLIKPMKNLLHSIFSGLGNIVGGIISAPFKIFSAMGRGAYENQKKRGAKSFEDQYREDHGFLASGWEKFKAFFKKDTEYGKARTAAQFGENGAWYDTSHGKWFESEEARKAAVRAETEAKIAAIENGTDVPKDDRGFFARLLSPRKKTTEVNTNPTVTPSTSSEAAPTVATVTDASETVRTAVTEQTTETRETNNILSTILERVSTLTGSFRGERTSDTSTSGNRRRRRNRRNRNRNQRNTGSVDTRSVTEQSSTEGTEEGYNPETVGSTTDTTNRPKKPKKGNFYTNIQKDVHQIADSVYGQLNGVGSNVNKIYRMMLKINNIKDDDIKGDNNKSYVGFFGKLRTMFNRPVEAIKNIITTPFVKIGEVLGGIKDRFLNIGNLIKGAGTALKNGVGLVVSTVAEIGKALGNVVLEVIKLPFDIIHTGLSAVRAMLPALGEALSATVSVIGSGIKAAGYLVVDSVAAIGNTIAGAARGFGQLLGGALSGLGSLLSAAGVIGGDILRGAWGALKFVGKGIGRGVAAVATAPFKAAKGLFNLGKNALGGRGPVHVIVDSGTLDLVKRIRNIEQVHSDGMGGDDVKPKPLPVKPILGGFGIGPKKKKSDPVYVVVSGFNNRAISNLASIFIGGDANSDTSKSSPFGNFLKKIIGFGKSSDEDKEALKHLDMNVGDTSVDTSMSGGGAGDDAAGTDASLADDDNRTSVATSIKNKFSAIKSSASSKFDALREKFNEKIANRQAQVDKGARASLFERFAASDKAKEESKFRTKLLDMLGKTKEATVEHKSIFSSMFGKKGLITAGIMLALPFVIKLLPKVIDFIKNFNIQDLIGKILKDIKTAFGEIGGLLGLVNNAGEQVEDAKNVINGTATSPMVDENGNLVYDEDGNLVTTPRDSNPVKEFFTPTRTRVDIRNGEWGYRNDWTTMSESKANLVGHKVVIPALKVFDKVAPTAKKIGAATGRFFASGRELNALKNAGYTELASQASFRQKIASGIVGAADNVAAGVANTAKNVGTKIASSKVGQFGSAVASKAGAFADDAARNVGKVASSVKGVADDAVRAVGNTEIVQKFITKAGEAITFLMEKLVAAGEKIGTKLPIAKLKSFIKPITDKLLNGNILGKFVTKIKTFFGKITAKATAEVGTAGILTAGFIVYGVLDGLSNAGALFEVNPSDVDMKMRAIAAVFKGLLNTTAGSVIDFINSLAYEILGINFLKSVASWAYDLMSSEEEKEALKNAQDDFTKGYEDYVAEEYEAYKKGEEGGGREAMSYEEFKASSLSTTRSEYNSKTNKSLIRRGYDLITGVGGGIKGVGAAVVNGAKGIGSGIVNGVKGIGSGIVNGVKGIGSGIASGATAVWNGVKGVGSGIASGASSVFNKGKEVLGNVGSALANVGKDGVVAAAGIMSGFKKISDNFYNKENSFMDYFKADVNPLKEDNMFHGAVGAVLNVSKFIMFPKLLVGGILKKVGTAVGGAISKVFDGIKTAVGDYINNKKDLLGTALRGDFDGLSDYTITTSKDNPIGGFINGIVGIERIPLYPVALVSKVARAIGSGILKVFDTVKQSAIDIGTNVATLSSYAFNGDIDSLNDFTFKASEDNPIGGFLTGILSGAKIFYYLPALVMKGGRFVADGIKKGVAAVANTVSQIGQTSVILGTLALNGDVEKLHDYEGVDEEGNPIGGFVNAIYGAEKFLLAPIGAIVSTGKAIGGFVTKSIGAVVDYGGKSLDFIKTLNEYTDPKKDMKTWDNESMAENESDVVGGVLSAIIKRVMGIYVGIVRAVKGAFSWLGDTVDGIGEAISGVVDDVGEFASNAVDTVKDGLSGIGKWFANGVNSLGTAIMNIGRGGNDGGRPVNGGKGEEGYLNGMPYYSQNDPRYKNKPYRITGGFGGDGATIGDAGCGPTAMAMVASQATGKPYDPITMAKMSEAGGYSTSAGTTPGYFSAAGNALGIPNAQLNPSQESLVGSLENGNSVILQGARGGATNSPYTSEGHYVTATGIDANNNVIINDPRGREYSGAYRMDDVLNDTTGMWAFGSNGGYGSPRRHGFRAIFGGKGPVSTATVVNDGGSVSKTKVNKITEAKNSVKTEAQKEAEDYEKWLSIVRAVKEAIAAQKPGYSQTRYIKITVGGRTISARTDCSGYVQSCLKYYGVMKENTNISSANVRNPNDATMKATGFTPFAFPGYDKLREGDILGRSGHTEIFAYIRDGKTYVYNCGDDASTNSAIPTSAGGAHETVWRLGKAGEDALSEFGVDGSTTASAAYDSGSSYSSSSTSTSTGTGIAGLLSGLAGAIMNPIYEKLGLKSPAATAADVVSDSYSSDSGSVGTAKEIPLSGKSNREQIWNYLRFTKNFSPIAAAGLMGAWQAESSNSPNRMEGDYLGDFPGYDKMYNDRATMNNWTQRLFQRYANNGLTINQDAYKGSDGNLYPGLGLAQWTGPRGEQLKKFGGSNWGTLSTQLQFAFEGPSEFNYRNKQFQLMDRLNNASTPEDAATVALDWYENSSADYHNKKPDFNAARRGYARSIYDELKNVQAPTAQLVDNGTNSTVGKKVVDKKNNVMISAMGGKGGKGSKTSIGSRRKSTPTKIKPVLEDVTARGGYGAFDVSPVRQDYARDMNPRTREIMTRDVTINSMNSSEITQLLKVMVGYLSNIDSNTGTTNTELDALNKKDFGSGVINQTNTSNTFNTPTINGSSSNPGTSDRSGYAVAKRLASGMLND